MDSRAAAGRLRQENPSLEMDQVWGSVDEVLNSHPAVGMAIGVVRDGRLEDILRRRSRGIREGWLERKAVRVLGDPDAPHTFTFIDDFAAGLVTLATHEEALGEVWHVPSAETTTTRRFVEMVFEQVGGPVCVQVAPRLAITVLALFNPTMTPVREVPYQSERPGVVDHRKYASAFGVSPTPHAQAIAKTLSWFREAGDAGS